MRQVQVSEYGGPAALELVEGEAPEPGPGEVLIDVAAAGVNFADIQQRIGAYPGGPSPPFVPGMEAAGTVSEVGEGADAEEGARVVAMTDGNGYAEQAVAPAESLLPVPEGMSFAEAAGVPVQFLTAHNALFDWAGLTGDERVLVHAAAGGVGTAAVQLASQRGAEVFGTASTERKRDLASDLGADHVIDYTREDFREVVDAETDGEGVEVVLDGVGGETFDRSLDALGHFGRLVTIGVASGNPPSAAATRLLMENKRVIGFHLGEAAARDPERVFDAVPELTELLVAGDVEVVVGERFDLAEASAAHEHIESRSSVGKTVLEP
jgi:NADPH2:quinone reductase